MRSEIELVPYAPGMLDASPLLVLAPHPDDEVFGCGGLLTLAGQAGSEVHVAVVTDGGVQGDPATRRAESRSAAQAMGLGAPDFWGFADRGLDPDDRKLRERIRETLLQVRPQAVLVTSPAEVHPDHRALALAVYQLLHEATSELADLTGETRVVAYEVSAVLRPNLLVDVTPVWEQVLTAARAFASQVEVKPYVEVLDAIATARRLSLPSGVRRAEAYHVVDAEWVREHPVVDWAAVQGPSAGLETDPPTSADAESLGAEVCRLRAVIREVEASRTWRLYSFFNRLLRRRLG